MTLNDILARMIDGADRKCLSRVQEAVSLFINISMLYVGVTGVAVVSAGTEEPCDLSNPTGGVGLVLVITNQYPKIVAIIPGGAADKSNTIHLGHYVSSIAEHGGVASFTSLKNCSLDEVSAKMTGLIGSTVALKVTSDPRADAASETVVVLKRGVLRPLQSETILPGSEQLVMSCSNLAQSFLIETSATGSVYKIERNTEMKGKRGVNP